jgi:hypothetical protein
MTKNGGRSLPRQRAKTDRHDAQYSGPVRWTPVNFLPSLGSASEEGRRNEVNEVTLYPGMLILVVPWDANLKSRITDGLVGLRGMLREGPRPFATL